MFNLIEIVWIHFPNIKTSHYFFRYNYSWLTHIHRPIVYNRHKKLLFFYTSQRCVTSRSNFPCIQAYGIWYRMFLVYRPILCYSLLLFLVYRLIITIIKIYFHREKGQSVPHNGISPPPYPPLPPPPHE